MGVKILDVQSGHGERARCTLYCGMLIPPAVDYLSGPRARRASSFRPCPRAE